MVSDGSRIYFNEGPTGSFRIAQVSVTGGAIASVETPFPNSYVAGVKPDGSALVAAVPSNTDSPDAPLWSIPLPAGEPRRLGSLEAQNADIFPDGRIVFAQLVRGKDPKGTDSRTDWLIADKDGANPRKLVFSSRLALETCGFRRTASEFFSSSGRSAIARCSK